MRDFVRILVFLAAFSAGGAAVGISQAVANGQPVNWWPIAFAIAFGMVIGGAVLWPFLAWQKQASEHPETSA